MLVNGQTPSNCPAPGSCRPQLDLQTGTQYCATCNISVITGPSSVDLQNEANAAKKADSKSLLLSILTVAGLVTIMIL